MKIAELRRIEEAADPEHRIPAAIDHFPALLKVAEVVSRRPNKFGPHYMIWQGELDAAISELEAVK